MIWRTPRAASPLLAVVVTCAGAAACSDDTRLLVYIEGDGLAAGEVAEVVVEPRDAAGRALVASRWQPEPGAVFPLVDARESADGATQVVVELRGRREVLARAAFELPAARPVELHARLPRGLFAEGCADFDGDGFGEGPACPDVDCDDGDPDAHAGAEERCGDGADGDCNGVIDDGCACEPGALQACYPGPRRALGFAACVAGTMTCDDDGVWGACTGAALPGPEAGGLRGEDDDCDGVFDEPEPCVQGEVMPCYSGAAGTASAGLCHGGVRVCSDGAFGECEGEVVPEPELCGNALDDDCDGVVDEAAEAGGCTAGELRLELGADGAGGFETAAAAADAQPCDDERAVTVAGGGVTFTRGGLDLDGAAYGALGLELGRRPALGGAEVGYTTAGGEARSGASVALEVEGTLECDTRVYVTAPAPWADDERVVQLTVRLVCADPAACDGAPLALRAVEVLR